MNISVPLGLVFSAIVGYFAVTEGMSNSFVFINKHAGIIVIGGTVAASLICFPIAHFKKMFELFFGALTGKNQALTLETIRELIHLSEVSNQDRPISGEISAIKNDFLKESLDLLEQGVLEDKELFEVLHTRVELQNEQYKRDGKTFKTIGKFPPAFGLIGTSVGMISLLQGLGKPDAFEQLGPAMSVSLVATFYGLCFSNFFLIPFGENISEAAESDLVMRRIVVEGVMLIKEKKHPLLVTEHLKSYLSNKERVKFQGQKAGS